MPFSAENLGSQNFGASLALILSYESIPFRKLRNITLIFRIKSIGVNKTTKLSLSGDITLKIVYLYLCKSLPLCLYVTLLCLLHSLLAAPHVAAYKHSEYGNENDRAVLVCVGSGYPLPTDWSWYKFSEDGNSKVAKSLIGLFYCILNVNTCNHFFSDCRF